MAGGISRQKGKMMQTTVKQHDGWTLKATIEEAGDFRDYYRVFKTREEAEENGRKFIGNIHGIETAREYEVYKHFPDPFNPVEV